MARFTAPPLHDFPDRAHRHLLENPDNLREFLQRAVPQVAAGLDFGRVRLLRRDQRLPDRRQTENDLLFEIPFCHAEPEGPATTLVDILVEHQSDPDPAMPLRTLLTATLHWTEQWRAWGAFHEPRQPLRLSPVVPIVFHTGDDAWLSYRTLADLVVVPEALQAHVPSWKPLFWQLFRQPPETLRQASGEWLRTMALVRAKDLPLEEYERLYAEVARSLEPLGLRDRMRWHELMDFLLAWTHYQRKNAEEITRLHAIAADSYQNIALREEVTTMSQAVQQTWAEWAKTHYTAEGEVRGELRANRKTLRLLLERRFSPLPAALVERIEACDDLRRLEDSIARVLDIQSPDELPL